MNISFEELKKDLKHYLKVTKNHKCKVLKIKIVNVEYVIKHMMKRVIVLKF